MKNLIIILVAVLGLTSCGGGVDNNYINEVRTTTSKTSYAEQNEVKQLTNVINSLVKDGNDLLDEIERCNTIDCVVPYTSSLERLTDRTNALTRLAEDHVAKYGTSTDYSLTKAISDFMSYDRRVQRFLSKWS